MPCLGPALAVLLGLSGGEIPWETGLEAAWKRARKERTGLLVFLPAGGEFEEADAAQEAILASSGEIASLSREVVCLRLEGEEGQAFRRRMDLAAEPTLLVFFRNPKDADSLERAAREDLTGSPAGRVAEWMRSSLFSGSDGTRLAFALVLALAVVTAGFVALRRLAR